MCKNLKNRENLVISLHPHNDRGCAVADSEMGLLAGGDRVEGTLFGNGERTGNVDVVTLALNLFSQGIDPGLDFSNLPALTEVYEKVTRMHVYERQPYSGRLVFAAFSGSHQDAIAKGVKFREEKGQKTWNVPYLPIDPTDVGRVYEADVIRINSQSGKGGVGYIMESQFNLVLPPKMREAFSYKVKSVSDHEHRELLPREIYDYFLANYVNVESPVSVLRAVYVDRAEGILADCRIRTSLGEYDVVGLGNGRLDAVSNALKEKLGLDYTLDSYTQHALEGKTTSEAASYVSIVSGGKTYFGTGIDKDIVVSGVKALVSAVNILLEDR
jgi:2-isopropylmalate synthase